MPTSTEDKPLHKNEGLKVESNFLRGTILEGLADESTGAISDADTQLTKFHGIYQQDDRDLRRERRKAKQEKAFSFMIRVRVPGGVCSSKQWLEMDGLASAYANETIKLTTRQAFQFHGVLKGNLKQTIKEINETLLDTLAACGDVNRNVMCNPNPYQSHVHAEVQKVTEAISDHLSPRTGAYHEIWLDKEKITKDPEQEEPLYGKTYLPRKFKTVVAVPPSNDVDIFAHDLGYIAIIEDDKLVGFNVTVGGGMGMSHNKEATFPRLAQVLGFCTPEQAVEVAEKIVMVQRDHGDRTDRAHARLKYTIEDHGLDWFRDQVEERLGYKLGDERAFTFDHNGDRYGWREGTDGKHHYTLFIQNGRVLDTEEIKMRTALREIAKIHEGDFRLTANQNLIIGGVAADAKAKIDALLAEYGLDKNNLGSALRLNSMACVALPTCGLALAESERYLPELVTELDGVIEEAGLREDALTIRMTGCPNGCARPYLAEIAMVGRAPGKYNLYLGGGFVGNRLNKLYRESVKSEELKPILQPMIESYAKEREDGERFGDFVIRKGIIKETTAGNNFHQNLGETK
ncbi:NADPH-dependent assimilatory sulfite reductase hemoprotein subunit [Verrucomicrobiales bacterium]|jgi:sulfite reductase (NADPH) hemoprotein beta-component|nr:NADPH-dependent assimilatory sulfite reductase hemoprotein subunit [Verrucomicrobiales bacterium]MDC0502852.1 NADPH-dependent assimilatory sulfite reductase hemoprotein subunit [Verrucomicrobiales bacterium]MDF1786645.1 NADPH-dependent assimilatory sulfite reductase hemoprotein subunit [Verrucomicrobiales bacterium]